jgi:hypothetical protein
MCWRLKRNSLGWGGSRKIAGFSLGAKTVHLARFFVALAAGGLAIRRRLTTCRMAVRATEGDEDPQG